MTLSSASDSDREAAPLAAVPARPSLLHSLAVLFKVRIVLLLLFAAVGGLFLGAQGWPGIGALLLIIATGGLAAAGSAAWNHYLEKDTDVRMERTRTRPLVTGDIGRPGWVPVAATLMILAPVLAVLPFNRPLSLFLLLGAVIYVGIYTLWLKPRTLLNIVVGGAAGSAAVLSGSAAAGAWNDPGALVLALLVFLWTPTHFWSLAIVYRDDYARGGVPMLPVYVSDRQSALWMMLHTLGAVTAALMLVVRPAMSLLYLAPVATFSLILIVQNVRLILTPNRDHARRYFRFSNYYLAVVLLMLIADMLVGAAA
ncbi:MAG: heme o synthase [Anaerolineales bacterium]